VLTVYALDPDKTVEEVEARPVTPRLEERSLSPAEVHTLRLQLAHGWRREALDAEIAEALREDPGHVQALTALAQRDEDRALALARRAVAAHPDDARAWQLLGEALKGATAAEERQAALRKAVELSPGRVEGLVALALEHARAGRPEEAERAARRVVALAPWSPVASMIHGGALADLGRCGEAISTMQRGLDVVRDEMPPELARELSASIADLEKRCAPRQHARPPLDAR
jgi:Flp pilus assembly protein TadD